MFISILGDSISTYQGYQPPGYAVYYQDYYRYINELNSVYDTWWAKVNQYLRAYICVDNAYSGSKVTGTEFPCACCEQRTGALHTPDKGLCFYDCYRRMLRQVKTNYPTAKIVCATLMRGYVRGAEDSPFPEKYAGVPFEAYNDAIRSAVLKEGVMLADLAASGSRYETLDGTHPTANGHVTLASGWIHCLALLRKQGAI